jgi:hypothetical protein
MTRRKRKPRELLDLRPGTDRLFGVLRQEFGVPGVYELRLARVEENDQRPVDLAAYAMWQIQLVHRVAGEGVTTTSEVVIMSCSQLAYHLSLLADEASTSACLDVILEVRQDLIVAAKVVAALDGSADGPSIELY